jgi:hypothetical protein
MTYAEFSGALDGGRGPSCVASGRGSGRRGGGSERRSHAPLSVGPLLAGCRAIADVGASRLELDTADADALVPSLRSSLSSSGSSDCTAACCIAAGHVVTKAKVRAVVDRAAASLAGRRRRPFQSREQAGAVATPTPPRPPDAERSVHRRPDHADTSCISCVTDIMLPIAGKHASRNTMTIITYFHRPKRTWKRKAQAAAIAGPDDRHHREAPASAQQLSPTCLT